MEGRRAGTVAERSLMAVSEEMERLRDLQTQLNFFRNSTELTYGIVLSGRDARLDDPHALISDALADVYSAAWYPSNQGRKKYRARVGSFLEQVGRDLTFVSRAVIVLWYSYFEQYLEDRLRPLRIDVRSWGPYTQFLEWPFLRVSPTPLRVESVLRADLCRHVRNQIVHGSRLPGARDDPGIVRWREARTAELKAQAGHTDPDRLSADAIEYVVGQAINHLKAAAREGRSENLEHFYMLFCFTNLDALAIDIESALIPEGAMPAGRISLKKSSARRPDLLCELRSAPSDSMTQT
ncbi:MAG: hypothetical protein Q8P50_04085 [Bacillota bacterium]|nr:hypothetical protein [Bacillota bacterium]